jgi:HD-GYP domain-containing protein (c-di-GMP phosphodiesterase class II)
LKDAGFVYDIGMLSVPEKILNAPAALSPQSRALVQKHCEAGVALLNIELSPLCKTAAQLAREHHERYDGDGYPHRRKGTDISMPARVLAVADAFVAMLHKRADRPALAFGHALDQIKRESGTHFDPAVVTALDKNQEKIAAIIRGE